MREDNILAELRLIRGDIKEVNEKVHTIDLKVEGNRSKLSLFVGGATLLFSAIYTILLDKIKEYL